MRRFTICNFGFTIELKIFEPGKHEGIEKRNKDSVTLCLRG